MVISWSPIWGDASSVKEYKVLLNKFPIVFIPKHLFARFLQPVLELVVEMSEPYLTKQHASARFC